MTHPSMHDSSIHVASSIHGLIGPIQVWCHDTATNTVRLQSDFKAGLETVVAGGG